MESTYDMSSSRGIVRKWCILRRESNSHDLRFTSAFRVVSTASVCNSVVQERDASRRQYRDLRRRRRGHGTAADTRYGSHHSESDGIIPRTGRPDHHARFRTGRRPAQYGRRREHRLLFHEENRRGLGKQGHYCDHGDLGRSCRSPWHSCRRQRHHRSDHHPSGCCDWYHSERHRRHLPRRRPDGALHRTFQSSHGDA